MRDGDDGRPGRPLGLRPFAGVRFTGSPGDVLARTADPPDSWAEVAPTPPDGVMDLLRAGFGGDADGPAPWARWFDAGRVRRDPAALYVYRRSDDRGATRGLVGAMDLTGGTSAPLLPHEEVHPSLVQAQREVTRSTRAQVDPVVAVAEPPVASAGEVSPLSRLLAGLTAGAPIWMTARDRTTHELWLVDEPDLVRAAAAVRTGPLVVADGHHRRTAWSQDPDGRGRAWGLVWIVDAVDEALRLDAVHRVCAGLTETAVLDSGLVDAQPLDGADAARRVLGEAVGPVAVLRAEGRFMLVRPAAGASAPRCTLPDHALCWLHQVWLPGWGVAPDAVEHVHGFDAAVRRADASHGVGVLLPAPAWGDVVAAALGGTPLPAKATSFTPKPRMGLVMRHWESSADDVTPPLDGSG